MFCGVFRGMRNKKVVLFSLTFFSSVSFALASYAQDNCFEKDYLQIYQQVMNGTKELSSLDQKTQICVSSIHSLISRSQAPKDDSDCEDAWSNANSAADAVESYARRLIRCVTSGDHSDGCYLEARRVRSNHSDYESAVSEVQSYCY